MAEFPTVFEDAPFRFMTGLPMHIDLWDDAVPCRHYRAHTIPFQWRAAFKAQLAFLVTKGVIEKALSSSPSHGGGPEEVVRRTMDHCGSHRPKQVRATSCLSHPSAKRGRHQHPTRHAVFYHVRLATRLLAGPPGRRKLEVDHLHHSVGSLPFPAKCHGAHVSRGRAKPARRRCTRRR